MMAKSVSERNSCFTQALPRWLLFSSGFPNPWDIILNKRRYEYAMVSSELGAVD